MKKILVVLGPTATGKTDLAINLAKKFNGELISCDSRQVYTGLDIGTGKNPSKVSSISKHKEFWIINGIKVWMYDMTEPERQYSVANYVKDAHIVIEKIVLSNKLPIIVGGTGLYLKALLYGLSNLLVPPNPALRIKLEKLPKDELQKELQIISPKRWKELNKSDKENPRRLVRAIELVLTKHKKNRYKIYNLRFKNKDILKIGLTASRKDLYSKADQRVIDRINRRMIGEAKNLLKVGLSLKRMRQLGLEYRVLANFLQGKIKDRDELIKSLQGKIHGFIRRQLTWFKKEKNVNWFNITDKFFVEKVEELISKWYDKL